MKKRSFSQWLQSEINKKGMSQADLARKSGISKAYISRIFSENRSPSAETLKAFAIALNAMPETVYRAAGLLPAETEKKLIIEELLFSLSHLTEDQQKQLLQYAKFMLSSEEEIDN